MPFKFKRLEIPDVILVIPQVFKDDRGHFLESYKKKDFALQGIDQEFVQDNHSRSKKGVFRGLHYQKNPMTQGKIVRVIKGKAIDYAVDMRRGSPTYGKYVSAELNDENQYMLWVPPGFAHGFLALEDNTEFHYKTTNYYSPTHEAGIKYNDPTIGLKLPLPTEELIIADKDKELPLLKDADNDY